ncbi:MAG: sodium/hydrogen exchanger [Candidatus Levybacteria bacterium]|nr:sodium/hydrogen exchanger [Candidatus Levybacteria bacterium]
MQNIFLEITIIICLASFFAVVFKWLKLPIILAYILTGIVAGPLGFVNLQSRDLLQTMGDVGVTFLLFMLGLEMKIRDFGSIGKTVFIVFFVQAIFTFLISYLAAIVLEFSNVSAIYIGIALVFSSTIIVVKFLSDKKNLHSLYGKFTIGILLLQDFLAIAALIFLSSFNSQTLYNPINIFLQVLLKGILIFSIVGYLSQKVFPKIVESLSKSSEILFLVSIGWVFGLAALISSPMIGFSVEIGGFLAGLALANSIANYQIIAKAKILRDFFIIIFFVILGIKMTFNNLELILFPVIAFSLIALILKPLIVMIAMGLMGFRKRTSFLSGVNLGQISEFSLILVFLGGKLGHLNGNTVSLITAVSIIAFIFSAYAIGNDNKVYHLFHRYLDIFERKTGKRDEIIQSNKNMENLKNHIVLIGGDQMGESILESLEEMNREVVVIDFDPAIVNKLKNKNVHRLFGDISDTEIKNLARIHTAHLIISTVPDVEDNLLLLREEKFKKSPAIIIVTALDANDAKMLYNEKADYVVLPHLAGGRQLAKILDKDLHGLSELKSKDQRYLSSTDSVLDL